MAQVEEAILQTRESLRRRTWSVLESRIVAQVGTVKHFPENEGSNGLDRLQQGASPSASSSDSPMRNGGSGRN